MALIASLMAQLTSQSSNKNSPTSTRLPFNPVTSPTRHISPIKFNNFSASRDRHRRLSLLSPALPPHHHHLVVLADYVPKFPRLFDTPVKDFIAPDVPLLPGFNADNMTRLFLPDLINPTNIYYLLLFISCAVAVVYLEIGALVNDFIQEKDFERLEEQFLRQQQRRKSKNKRNSSSQNSLTSIESEEKGEERLAVKMKELSPEEIAYKERKRGLGWLAFITAIAIWCTGVLNKLNPLQP